MSPPRLRIWHTCGSVTQHDPTHLEHIMWITYQEELYDLFRLCQRDIKSIASSDTGDPEKAAKDLEGAEGLADELDNTELPSEEESQHKVPKTLKSLKYNFHLLK